MKRKLLLTLGIAVFICAHAPLAVNAAPASAAAEEEAVEVSQLSESDIAMLYEMFDAEYYAKTYPEIMALVGNDPKALFNNFITEGFQKGRQLNSEFNVSAYRSAYPDLSAAFGRNIMDYYKHYNTIGKAEGRTITTVAKAQEHGIIVTSFTGTHLAVDAGGNVVSGKDADKIIVSNPVYSNAVDNIGGKTVAEIRQETEVSAAAPIASGNTDAADTPAEEDNKSEKEEINARLARYNAAYAAWQAAKPDKSKYVKNGTYETQEAAEAAYEEDHAEWSTAKPAVEYDTAAYNAAHAEWEEEEPQLAAYGLKEINTGEVTTVCVLADKADPSVAVTVTVRDGYAVIGDVYYKEADQDAAYTTTEVLNDGYVKTADGVFYKNTAAADSDAYTITEEVLKSGYAKKDDGSYIKIVDESDATQEVSGYSTYDLNGTTVYYYSEDRLDLQQDENEIFVSRETQRTDVTAVYDDGNTFYYDSEHPEYQEAGISLEDFKSRISWGGTDYNEDSYYILDNGIDTCYLYKKLTYEDITVPDVLKKGVIRNEIGEYYKYRDEPKTEIKDDYYFDETNNRYYTGADEDEAVDTPYSETLNEGYILIEGEAYKEVEAEEATTEEKTLNEGYVEDDGVAYSESTKEEATTDSLNDGYVTVKENDETVYYKTSEGSTELSDYNDAVENWNGEEPEQTDYVTDEYKAAEEAWEQEEPDAESDDYSYGVTGYETQEEADEAYEKDVEEWKAEEPKRSDF